MGRWVSFKQDYESQDKHVRLGPEESHHLARVLRARVGDAVTLLNGRGLVGTSTVERIDPKGSVELTVLEVATKTPPKPPIELALGLPKPKALEQILRQATELGVTAIRLLDCEHRAYALEARGAKWERLEAIVVEACKQSLNPFLPQLHVPVAFQDYLATLRPTGARLTLVASLEEDSKSLKSLKACKLEAASSITCFVGPEGDFSATEYASLKDVGALSLSLGPTILRVETAVAAVLAQVRGAFL